MSYFAANHFSARHFQAGMFGEPATSLAPVADFIASPVSGVGPLLVSFTNLSTNANTYRWYFTNGVSVDSTAQNPTVLLPPGSYSVRLEVEGVGGTDSIIKTNYITVSAPPPGTGKSKYALLQSLKAFGYLDDEHEALVKMLTVQKTFITVRRKKDGRN